MRSRKVGRWLMAAALGLGVVATSAGAAIKEAKSLIGHGVLDFSLPSTQDRLIKYGHDYYGKYNLIITFFPAAFTPV